MRPDLLIACGAMMAASLGGCVSHTWVPGPDAHKTFEEQTARCRILARHGGSGFYASGSASYVAGVAIGNAIGNAIQANADFNDCMAASGWEVADQASTPAPTVAPTALTAHPLTPTAIIPSAGPSVAPMTAASDSVPLTPCGEDRPCSQQTTSVR
jgi:hypothetical protein